MAAQRGLHRTTGTHAGESLTQRTPVGMIPENVVPGRQNYGRPVTHVDFFRRMPAGGGTVYFKPPVTTD